MERTQHNKLLVLFMSLCLGDSGIGALLLSSPTRKHGGRLKRSSAWFLRVRPHGGGERGRESEGLGDPRRVNW